METETERYELVMKPEDEKKQDDSNPAKYTLSKVINPYELDNDFFMNKTT